MAATQQVACRGEVVRFKGKTQAVLGGFY